jgi:hypothetical protein
MIHYIENGKYVWGTLTQERVNLARNLAKKKRGAKSMQPTSKNVANITVTFKNGDVVNVDPSTGHSLIFAIYLEDGFLHVISGKASILALLFRKIVNLVPQFLDIALDELARKRLDALPDETFRDIPVAGNA